MAVTSTSATTSIFRPNFRASQPQQGGQFSNSISLAIKPRRFWIRSSGDAPVETTDEADSKSPVETPKGPPSLISALNVEKALRGIGKTENYINFKLLFFFFCPSFFSRFRILKFTLILNLIFDLSLQHLHRIDESGSEVSNQPFDGCAFN